jgi:uncharacterized protein
MENEIWLFILIGFSAQLIDGALGMAYGLISSTFLISIGVPPAVASASVHTAEVVTTGISGASHAAMGNVDRKLLFRLAIPGAIGGAIGAYFLSTIDGDTIKPFVLGYLVCLGAYLLFRALHKVIEYREVKRVPLLGFGAGMLDAIGGGGWGSIATSTLLAQGGQARTSIGTVNAAEFVVSLAISISFFLHLGIKHWDAVLGLLIGGALAAPLAAWLVKHIAEKKLMLLVASAVLLISGWQLAKLFIS